MEQTELIRVYFPEVIVSDTITALGLGSYSNTTVQDIVDEGGPLYIEKDYKGDDMVCMVGIYGSVKLTGTFNNRTVIPIPVEPVFFVRGRPDDRR